MAAALVLILVTVLFVVMVTWIVNPPAQPIPISARLGRRARAIGRSISRSSTAHLRKPRQRRPRLQARPVAKFTASWRLLLAVVLLAVGAAMAALLAIRSIFGLLEGMVS